jgi:UDP-N-acetylglucosamine diphosphorylase/glucosamine-1-phosphate N-acetyltransferase
MKKAALMAAGDSTRMLPLSANRPKHLLPVAGTPLIFHTLKGLRDAGIRETLIIHGYHGDILRDAIDAVDWGRMNIVYIEQKERKGTAHAAGHARDFAGDEDIIIMNGDVLTAPDTYMSLIAFHEKHKFSMSISVLPVADPSAYGVVEAEGIEAKKLIEKPTPDQSKSNLCNMGIYAAGPDLWDAIDRTELSTRKEYEITDSIEMLINEGKVGVHKIESWWLDIGKPWDLLAANEQILKDAPERIRGTVEEGAVIKGSAIVEPSAVIKSGAYIEGPVYIGPECVIGPNCYIRPYTSLGRKVKIGNAVEIKNSIIMDHTNVGHLSYVGDSVIGMNSNFGAGTITANLRHDNADIKVTVKGARLGSGRRKLGAIIGDDVKTGIGTSISTGIVLHQGAGTGIGVIVDRDIPPYTLVTARQTQQKIETRPLDRGK